MGRINVFGAGISGVFVWQRPWHLIGANQSQRFHLFTLTICADSRRLDFQGKFSIKMIWSPSHSVVFSAYQGILTF